MYNLLLGMGGGFSGGVLNAADIYTACEMILGLGEKDPSEGEDLIINNEALGQYDYCVKVGNQTVSAFSDGDWFTANEDARAAFVIVDGNLTINSGQVFRPAKRKLFTVIYVDGDLTVNGSISMTARGSNHTGTGISGGEVTKGNIRIATGTFSGVTNPQIPASGGAGGAGVNRTTSGNSSGNAGSNGTDGATGGGGSGAIRLATTGNGTSGAGAAGTSFSGGSSGASGYGNGVAGSGEANGGKGGNDITTRANPGTGNPHGNESSGTGGQDGTGGVLIVICTGALKGAGTIVAQGVRGAQDTADGNWTGAGGSGGGSVTVIYGSDSSTITPSAAGGAGGTSGGAAAGVSGGAGGNGTARKLSLS